MQSKQKIFCVGLSKTATTSLAHALELLGITCAHYPIGAMCYQDPYPKITQFMNSIGYRIFNYPLGIHNYRLREQCIDLSSSPFDKFDAFADIPIAHCYKQLDKMHPGSKFILTTREIDSWLKSCSRHMGKPYREGKPNWWNERKKGKWDDQMSTNMINRLNHDVYGSTTYKKEPYREAYIGHVDQVIEYFRGRDDDLLIIDITAGQAWEKLCPFLNMPIPQFPFPVQNISKQPTAPVSAESHENK